MHRTAGDLSAHSRLTHDSEDEPETPRGWPGSARTLDPGQLPASPAAAAGRRPTLGRPSVTGDHHHEVQGRTAHCQLTSGSRRPERHPRHTGHCRAMLVMAAELEQFRSCGELDTKTLFITSHTVSRHCLLQVAGDLHVGGRASAESARPSAFEGASAADAGPDDVRDSQSDGTLIESDLEVGCNYAAHWHEYSFNAQ